MAVYKVSTTLVY